MIWAIGQKIKGGDYVIEQVLGQGGFGITYKALQVKLNRPVVIKTTHEYLHYDPEYDKYIKSFITEGRTLAHLSQDPHPHIVGVIELFREGKTYCLVTEFVKGENLFQVVKRRGALPEEEIVPYIRQIGEALMVVHEAGLAHRDAHPGNIMLRNNGRAVLIDFGIAKQIIPATQSSTNKDAHKGFAPYEQIYRGSREPTVDVYCLAATLYYAVTGQKPIPSLARKLDNVPFIPPQQIIPSISYRLNQAILNGMALEAKDRPQSMQAWLGMLSYKPQVSSSEVKVPTSEVKVPTSEVKVPTSEVKVPTSEVKVPTSEVKVPTSEVKVPTSEVKAPTSEVKVPTSEVKVPTSEVKAPTSEVKAPTSEVKAPKVFTPIPINTVHTKEVVYPISRLQGKPTRNKQTITVPWQWLMSSFLVYGLMGYFLGFSDDNLLFLSFFIIVFLTGTVAVVGAIPLTRTLATIRVLAQNITKVIFLVIISLIISVVIALASWLFLWALVWAKIWTVLATLSVFISVVVAIWFMTKTAFIDNPVSGLADYYMTLFWICNIINTAILVPLIFGIWGFVWTVCASTVVSLCGEKLQKSVQSLKKVHTFLIFAGISGLGLGLGWTLHQLFNPSS